MLFVLVSCSEQEPIQIRITATPQAVAQSEVTIEPTNTNTPLPTVVAPTDTETAIPEPTNTSLPSVTATQVGDGRFFGPIVGADYVPPPTSTPAPALTPTPSEPSPTPIPQTSVSTPVSDSSVYLDPEQMGIQLYYNVDIDTWWQLLQRTKPMRVGWVKMQADWAWLQPDNAQQFDETFRLFEAHVQQAHNNGFKVLVSVAKAPAWARNGVVEEDGAPANPQDLANFITFMLDRFGEQVSGVEIWNEPNLRREWNGNLEFSGAAYMDVFRAGYNAVRAYNPNMPVITAGLAPTSTNAQLGSIDDREFLRQMYDAGLGSNDFTNIAIGVHPYGWGNPPDVRCCDAIPDRGWDDDPHFFFIETIEAYREIMVNNGDSDRQMWATEFGWGTWSGIPNEPPDGWMLYNSVEQQADYTIRAFEIGQSLDYVGVMFLWNLNFANPTLVEQRNEMVSYSLFVPDQAPRPLYDRLINRPE